MKARRMNKIYVDSVFGILKILSNLKIHAHIRVCLSLNKHTYVFIDAYLSISNIEQLTESSLFKI